MGVIGNFYVNVGNMNSKFIVENSLVGFRLNKKIILLFDNFII